MTDHRATPIAQTSPSRTLEVVRHLSTLGIPAAHHTHTHAIYRIADTHPLTPALTVLFDVAAALSPTSEEE